MNVPLIEIAEDQAKQKLKEYRRLAHERADQEAIAVMKAYQQCAKGKRLVDVREAIIAGGFNNKNLPRIAIAAADREQVILSALRERLNFASTHIGRRWSDRATDRSPRLSFIVNNLVGYKPPLNGSTFYSLVPAIPPNISLEMNVTRSQYHILYEVPERSDRPFGPVPRDPYLLRRIHGDLFAIEAEWELTELESRIIGGIRNKQRN